MSRRRRFAALLAVLGVLTLSITASGGFSSMTAGRGVDVAVVPDDEAFLGVDVDGADGDDRTAISFVGFCVADGSELNSSADVRRYKAGAEDPTEEALAVAWRADASVSTVVLKTDGGADEFRRFDVDGATNGTADVQGGVDADLHPSSYCPDGQHEAGKLEAGDDEFDLADGATPVGEEVTVTNRFGEPLTAVEVSGGGVTRTLADAGETELGVGESATLTLPGDCEAVTVVAKGEGTEVRLRRDCP
jgi:hypothetical protein